VARIVAKILLAVLVAGAALWGVGMWFYSPLLPEAWRPYGVVAYESAHIDGVESEKIVHSGHPTQSNPETIAEVQRILREHIGVK